MQNSAWISLLQHLPRSMHDAFSLVTKTGIEIALQAILRMEEDFLVIRGRLAGTQEGGRAFFIPYADLAFVMSSKPMAESQVQGLFNGTPVLAFAAETPPPPTEPETIPQPEAPAPEPVAEQTATPSPPPSPRPAVVKKNILDRLRARSHQAHAQRGR